jgi:glycerol-3-phosphate dehydrogenase
MRQLSADVVVIGGGSTGVGVVRDLAMRGYKAVLLERADLAQGTAGRFHGLLHSGGRYVVSDPESARECAEENAIITRIQPMAVESTGGLFIALEDDEDPTFPDKFLEGAKATGVWAEEISRDEAFRLEPRLNPKLTRAFKVHDGSVDGWQLVWSAALSAMQHGAYVEPFHMVTEIHRTADQVTGVTAVSQKTGEVTQVECRFILNCAGPWAGRVANLANLAPVQVVPGRGIMIAMNHRLVNRVVNRCIKPADGDILVPSHTVCIIGTTDVKVDDPDKLEIAANEVQQMFDAGEKIIPGFRQSRAVHAWAGARPLIKDNRVAASDTRHMSRGMAIIDHKEHDGLSGMLTIGGGKLTTYRLMAQHIVDAMEDQLGEHHECRTALEPCPPAASSESGNKLYTVSHRLESVEEDWGKDQLLCECELVTRDKFDDLFNRIPNASLDDLRRQLRVGMGPCQGGFCTLRAAGAVCQKNAGTLVEEDTDGSPSGSVSKPSSTEASITASERGSNLLRTFLDHRWIGLWPIMHDAQLRQAALDYWIYQGTYDVDHLPGKREEVI